MANAPLGIGHQPDERNGGIHAPVETCPKCGVAVQMLYQVTKCSSCGYGVEAGHGA